MAVVAMDMQAGKLQGALMTLTQAIEARYPMGRNLYGVPQEPAALNQRRPQRIKAVIPLRENIPVTGLYHRDEAEGLTRPNAPAYQRYVSEAVESINITEIYRQFLAWISVEGCRQLAARIFSVIPKSQTKFRIRLR
ncbi:MAG: hypothetical protein LBF65_02940 [Holosporales bacterium]|jgi:hypothetical protein|nr:hypothetical protein [Holosporales bacterium]